MIDAKVNYNVDPECIEKFGEYLDPENVVFGNTDCFQYINFQGGTLRGFRITGTEGSKVEARFNKTSSLGTYTSFSGSIDSSGILELMISEDLPYAHLNGIVTVGPSKIEKIETIQNLEEPVDIKIPNPDKTYVAEINNAEPSCTVKIGGTCDYIEYEKYLGKVTEIGRGTVHINSVPEIEIVYVAGENHGLISSIDNRNRQIVCSYNTRTTENVHYDIFQVKIENNIVVDGNTISTERLNSDYKIKIEQTGIIWKIANSPDYTYVYEVEGGSTKNYGIYLLEHESGSTRTLKILTNRLDYTGNLTFTLDSAVSGIFNIVSTHLSKHELIDGEYWNVYEVKITATNTNSGEEWRPKTGEQDNPYIVVPKYNNVGIDTISFCPIQLKNIEPKIGVWEETLPGKFTKVEDGVLRIFNSMTKNFIVVRNPKDGETENPNWYYYDLNGINKFYLTDSSAMITNVGVVFLDFDQTSSIIEVSRETFGRVLNVNRSDLINSLGTLTVTENSAYPGSWRNLINNNMTNV